MVLRNLWVHFLDHLCINQLLNLETHWILFVLFIPIKFRHLINHVSLDFNLIIAHQVVKETVNFNLHTEEEVVL